MDEEDKILLLKLAREAIATHFENKGPNISDVTHFKDKQGVFVTLHKHGHLRGCVGFPYPIMPLFQAIIEAAKSAAFNDTRFMAVTKDELRLIDFEISVLSAPQKLVVAKSEEYSRRINIGKDGLIIKDKEGRSGLLLPQVATENSFTPMQFLNCLCQKAGLSFNAWRDEDVEIFKFQAEVFGEKELGIL